MVKKEFKISEALFPFTGFVDETQLVKAGYKFNALAGQHFGRRREQDVECVFRDIEYEELTEESKLNALLERAAGTLSAGVFAKGTPIAFVDMPLPYQVDAGFIWVTRNGVIIRGLVVFNIRTNTWDMRFDTRPVYDDAELANLRDLK